MWITKVHKSITKKKPTAPWALINRHQVIDRIMTLTTPLWDSKAKRLKPKMTIAQACSELGITPVTYNSWLREDALLAQMVEEVKASHRQMMDDMSEGIILEWLNGDVKLRPNERIQLAKWYSEKTNPYYNPSQKIELEASNVNYAMTEEEIISRLKELSQETGDELLLPNITNQEDVQFTSSDTIEESVRCEEVYDETPITWGETNGRWD